MAVIQTSIELEASDAQRVIVRQLIEARKKVKQPAVSFSGRLASVHIADTMQGSSTLTLDIIDPGHELLTSGYFDVRGDGKLDPLQITYPLNTDNHWRLTAVDFGADEHIQFTMMETVAVEMQQKLGPLKTSRAKKTRAEFLAMLVAKTDKDVEFVSRQLHKTQRKTKKPKDKITDEERKATKGSGIHRDTDVTFKNWDGSRYTLKPKELKNAEIVCDAITATNAPEKAAMACLTACIVEGPFFRNPSGGEGSSAGILQLLSGWGSVEKRRDIAWTVEKFLQEGFYGKRDPSAKGAIDLANKHEDWSVGEIAQETQGSGFPDRYEKVKGGAEKVWEAYGGGGLSGAMHEGAYNFQVGGRSHPKENYWDAANRIADEVNWAFFLDGDHAYYDSEQTLITAKPAAVIQRNGAYVVDWHATWDERHIATEMTLSMICEPFQFRAGEVLQLEGFGPLTTGSTAKPKKLPGRWLISQMERDISNLATDFTLKQPENPKAEPRGQMVEGKTSDVVKGDLLDAMHKISKQQGGYAHENHGVKFSSMRPSDRFDCSSSCSYALWLADMWPSGNDMAMVSGQMATSWGKPGRGETFTVWANAGHVFMLAEGGDKWRFDTGGPGGGSGAKFYKDSTRPTDGFTPRHWKGA